jgi:hypothetical protein
MSSADSTWWDSTPRTQPRCGALLAFHSCPVVTLVLNDPDHQVNPLTSKKKQRSKGEGGGKRPSLRVPGISILMKGLAGRTY